MKKRLTTESMKEIRYLSDPQHSPDGNAAAVVCSFAEEEEGTFHSEIIWIDLTSGKEQRIGEGGNAKSPRFSKDGSYLAYLCDRTGEFQIWIREKDGNERKLTSLRHGIRHFCISPDGSCVAFEANLWEKEVEAGLAFTEMTFEEKEEWLAAREMEPVEITEIDYKSDECKGVRDGSTGYIGLAELSGVQQLMTEKMSFSMPVFSPDGKTIACYGMPYGGAFYSFHEIFLLGMNQEPVQLTDEKVAAADVPVEFTEDGKALIYPVYYMEGDCSIEYLSRVELPGGETKCLFDPKAEEVSSGVYGLPLMRTQYGEEKPYFLVDGNWVYYLSGGRGAERLYRISVQGGIPEMVLEGEFSIHEFCRPVRDMVLLTRGDYHTIRELYLYSRKGDTFHRLRDSNPWLSEYELGEVQQLSVPSLDNKVTVQGYVCRPAGFEEGKKYPAVLYLHGGPESCYNNDFWHEVQILSGDGYAVLCCDPRGSYGYGLSFGSTEASQGMQAYEDLMQFVDGAIALGFIDETRLGVTGGSYGGYMTCKIIMRTDRFRAAAGQRVFVNRATAYGTGDNGFLSAVMDTREINIEKILLEKARSSILKDVDRVRTPLLLLHGYQDYRCTFEQAEQMFVAVKERCKGVPVRLVMFPGENHGISRSGLLHFQQRHLKEILDWFARYVKGDEGSEANKCV